MVELRTVDQVRLDKWLWAARFFKTRGLATEAVGGGHVHLNGNRVKPSRHLVPGDRLTIRKGGYTFEVTVLKLAAQRGPAEQAAALYEESEASRQAREELAAEQRLARSTAPRPEGRPDKRQRRHIVRFTGKG